MLRGRASAAANVIEKVLGSSLFALICFLVLTRIVVDKMGFGFFEYMLATALYINFSVKIEQTHAAIREMGGERG